MNTELIDSPDNAVVLIRDTNAFIAGVNWKPVPARYRKNVRTMAQREGADRFVTYRYAGADGEQQLVAGMINQAMLAIPKAVKKTWALGLLIAPVLAAGGYAILPLSDGRYHFVGCMNGFLISDVTGERESIEQSRITFTSFNKEPEQGWLCFLPDEWGIEGSRPFDLDSILNAPRFSASACFAPVSVRKPITWGLGTVLVLLALAYGWSTYRDHQAKIAIEAARKAHIAQEIAKRQKAKVNPPWLQMPRVQVFINTCASHWQPVPLSVAGWVFTQARCSADGIRFAYRSAPGITVGDFSQRVKQIYGDNRQPYFNLPGTGNTGGFTEPLTFDPQGNEEEELPDADAQIQRIATFAQKSRLQFSFKEESSRFVDETGIETILPWHSYSYSLETAIPPTLLFDGFNDKGVRINTITLSLAQGRITYKIDGIFYAKQ